MNRHNNSTVHERARPLENLPYHVNSGSVRRDQAVAARLLASLGFSTGHWADIGISQTWGALRAPGRMGILLRLEESQAQVKELGDPGPLLWEPKD